MDAPVKKKFRKTVARKHLVGEVTPRRSPRVSKAAGPSVGELPEVEGQARGGTPRCSPHVLATVAPTPSPLGAGAYGKGKKCGIKRKVAPANVNKDCKKRSRVDRDDQGDADFNADDDDAAAATDHYQVVKRPVLRKRGGKSVEEADEGGDDAKRFNKMVRCSLKEVKLCAKLLQLRHKERVIKAGFGSVFDLTIDFNISRPLMGHIYTKIDPLTMIWTWVR